MIGEIAMSIHEGRAPSSNLALEHLRRGDTLGIKAFEGAYGHKLSTQTNADIFEVKNGEGRLYAGLDEDALRASLQSDALDTRTGRRVRIIFLDGNEHDPERLPITSESLKLVHHTYDITPRFSFYMSRQQMVGHSLRHNAQNHAERLQFWYSAVKWMINTVPSHHAADNCVGASHRLSRVVHVAAEPEAARHETSDTERHWYGDGYVQDSIIS